MLVRTLALCLCVRVQSKNLTGQRLHIIIVAEGAVDSHLKPLTAEYIRDVRLRDLLAPSSFSFSSPLANSTRKRNLLAHAH